MKERYDLAVVGAGSGGIGAAIAAARLGTSVLVVEKADRIGGTAVRAGVSIWEPAVGATGIPFDLYRRLKQVPKAVGVYTYHRHSCWPAPRCPEFRGGEFRIDSARRYMDSLRRHSPGPLREAEEFFREYVHGVVFEPDAYAQVVERLLAETGRCTVRKDATFTHANADSGHIRSLRLDDGTEIEAKFYADCTADALLCQACGCETLMGQDGRRAFGEPDAPEEPTSRVNGVTLIYRVAPTDSSGIEPLPPDVPSGCWWADSFPSTCAMQYPCGDVSMNMLPTLSGEEFLRIGYEAAYAEARRRVLAHWHHNQTVSAQLRGFRMSWIAPALGVRETRRVACEYMLTEHDLVAGLKRQTHPDIIAIADHPMDTHGKGGKCGEVLGPYGVPYRCLIPRGFANLLVACRGAGFSSLAASSCRLSRTMMHLGQAAGTAAALAGRRGISLPDVAPEELRQSLREQHVQLDWPMPEDLRRHIENEDAD